MTPDQPHDQELIAQATRFKELRGLNDAQFGLKVGYSGTVIYRWLNAKYQGNITLLEATIRDALRSAEEREKRSEDLFETHATQAVRAMANLLKRNHWMGAGYGDAGIGKTCGAHKALLADLSAIFITIVCYERDKNSLLRLIWDQMRDAESRGTGNRRMIDQVHDALRGSNRMIIVDQAHLLNKLGRQFFCDLHDRTNIAILLLGNPEMFNEWREQEQQFSRLRIVEKISLQSPLGERAARDNILSGRQAAEEMLRRILPEEEAGTALLKRAEMVAQGAGHLRTLETILKGARSHREKLNCSWADAFDAAQATTAGQFVE